MSFIKLKNFCAAKAPPYQQNEKEIHGMGENICKNYISYKGLLSRIYKEILRHGPVLKMCKGVEYSFSKWL